MGAKTAGMMVGVLLAAQGGLAGEVAFAVKPSATTAAGDTVVITFTLDRPADAEVAVLNQAGAVVRHLAAGVLGGSNAPPVPLKPGLAQRLVWDGTDDFGKPVPGAPQCRVRVRAGTGVTFGRFIAANPYNFGRAVSSAVDEDGNIYVLGFAGQLNQGHMCLRVFDQEGRYLREILPFPAHLPKNAVGELARWDEESNAFRPANRRNLNPDFYGQPGGRNVEHYPLTLVSASKTDGVVLAGHGGAIVLETTGAFRGRRSGVTAPRPQRGGRRGSAAPEPVRARLTRGRLPIDFNRFAVDSQRDEVYVSDGVYSIWRFSGDSGEGRLLTVGNKAFYAADLAVGYDGLLYVRKCMGHRPGVTDFSGPFERYTRALEPAPYPSGTHVLSKYVYGRYGVGYADRGIGVGPDGTAYISFMYEWVKYCTAGFGPDGTPLKGKHLKGLVGNREGGRNRYPAGLTSAVIGPITGGNGGVRVDLAGNVYVGMWLWPKDVPVPAPFAADPAYACSTGSVFKFGPSGGFVTSPRADWSSDPVGSTPRTPGAFGVEVRSGGRTPTVFYDAFVEGAVAAYPGYAPFSHANWGGNSCCVCRVPRFDLDRYGRLYLPNAITNSVRIVDNAGNQIIAFGAYGNFDSQYVPPGTKDGKPVVSVPAIPLTWPTGAGASEKAIYVLDTYSRRVVRVVRTYAAEAMAEVR